MKLVIKEYLQTLKEKDELDLLLCDLLLLDGYETHNLPKTGDRQYGVDIIATKTNSVFLFVLKQQNIGRATWDTGPDSVRQSLNDILDVYIPNLLPLAWRNKKINIIVATNGYMEDAVKINWVGFQKNNARDNICYDFWDIDKFVNLCNKYAFNEHLFGKNLHSDLRKVLYFMEESDFDYLYFEKIIDTYITQLNETCTKLPTYKKRVTSMYMCISLITQWAKEKQNFKTAISLLEYTLIKYWGFLQKNKLLGREKYVAWHLRFLKQYEKYNDYYYHELKSIANKYGGIPYYNPLEHRIILYDVIGRLSSYGLYLYFTGDMARASSVLNTLIQLVNNNQDYKYPVYDNQIIELSMVFLLLLKLNKMSDLGSLLHMLIMGIKYNYFSSHKYPSPHDSYDEALLIEMGEDVEEYNASVLFGGLLEWACLINDTAKYNALVEFIKESFPQLTCQTWQINYNEEQMLYEKYTTYNAGISIVLRLNLDMEEQKEVLLSCNDNVSFEKFSFNEYCFYSLPIVVSRYFKYPILPQFWRSYIQPPNKQEEKK